MAPQRSRTNEEARRSGPPVQGLTSRISSQHHRCNGKSFQCPFNVTTFRGYTLLWASALLSFPCTCYYAPIPAVRNPDTPPTGQLFVYFRKCSTAHPIVAILRIRVRIEPVHMCNYVHPERHAGRIGPVHLPPTDHLRTNRYRNAHSIPSTFRSITILSITDGIGYRQKSGRNAKRRSCAGCTLSATPNPANCPVTNQEHHQPHVCEDIHHALKTDIPSPIRTENTESCMSRHAQPDRSRRTRPALRKFHRIAHAMTHTTWQKLPTQQPQTVMPDIPICPDREYHRN